MKSILTKESIDIIMNQKQRAKLERAEYMISYVAEELQDKENSPTDKLENIAITLQEIMEYD